MKADDDPHDLLSGGEATAAAADAGRPVRRVAAPYNRLGERAVISVSGLRKSYGDFEAVRGLDLEVRSGEVFAFLGPNGAGKTTTTEILEGYRERSAGSVSVLGDDPSRPEREWRERIGIVLQQCRMRPELTVRETLELYAGYYREPLAVDDDDRPRRPGREGRDARRAASRAASCAASTSASR